MVELGQQSSESRLDEGPGALILGLLLEPGDAGVLVALEGGLDGAEGEGGELLEPDNGDVLDASLVPFTLEFVVDLAAAVDDLLDLIVSDQVCSRILKDPLEPKPGLEVVE